VLSLCHDSCGLALSIPRGFSRYSQRRRTGVARPTDVNIRTTTNAFPGLTRFKLFSWKRSHLAQAHPSDRFRRCRGAELIANGWDGCSRAVPLSTSEFQTEKISLCQRRRDGVNGSSRLKRCNSGLARGFRVKLKEQRSFTHDFRRCSAVQNSKYASILRFTFVYRSSACRKASSFKIVSADTLLWQMFAERREWNCFRKFHP